MLEDRLARLIERPFAHRGLHGGGRIENSPAAFDAAIQASMGIELDVRLSRDGQAMVFHDSRLDRLAGIAGEVGSMDAAALNQIRLKGSNDRIPTLGQVLAQIKGRVPLLVEIKTDGRAAAAISIAVARALEAYSGAVGVMSFDPQVGHWFRRHAPSLLRGLVVSEAGRKWRFVLRHLAVQRARPHFLAYDIRDLPSRFAAAQRARGLKLLTWTCRSDEEKRRAAIHADQIIHEIAQ